MKPYPYSGAVLAGGLNSRMGGRNKALLTVGNRSILDHLDNALAGLFEETILVTNSPLDFLSWEEMIVSDLLPVRSSLTGIHTAVFHASFDHVFVTACDTPFLKKELVILLLDILEPKWDVVIPETKDGLQPLCAVYSKRCLKPMERQLRRESPKIVEFFSQVRVKKVSESEIRHADPELVSFFNVNTPEDLQEAERIWDQRP